MMEGDDALCKKCIFTRVLVVGHGPSFRDFEYIRNFDGMILAVDFSGKELVENGIIPDYILFSEISEGIMDFVDHTLPMMYVGMPIKFIHRESISPQVQRRMDEMKLQHSVFIPQYTPEHLAVGNVGLYSIAFAQLVLYANEIHLIGMDYRGPDSGGRDYSKEWIKQAKHYLARRNPNIIDHSNGDFPKS